MSMSNNRWTDRMWWVVVAFNTLGAIAGFATGEFWRPFTCLGIAALAYIIIANEREIRRLRAMPPRVDTEYFVIREPRP